MSQLNTANQQFYDYLVTHNFDPELLNVDGTPTTNPGEAAIMSFDYKTPTNDYGTVVFSIEGGKLQIYFGDNLGKTMEGDDKKDWYDFLQTTRMIAKRNMLDFDLKNLNQLKHNMKTMAALQESRLFEGYYGTKKRSYSDQPKQTRLIINHNKALGEGEQRFRHIESLFLETSEGERFKLPFTKLSGGKAMARHVSEGGTPYDAFGQHISEMVDDMNTLGSFVRAVKSPRYTGEGRHLVKAAVEHYNELKNNLKAIQGQRGYRQACEAYDPAAITAIDEAVETIRTLFTDTELDPRVERAIPVLAKIQDMEATMPEVDEFEAHMNSIAEGTWSLPDNAEAESKLKELMAKPLMVGPDASNATEVLYDIVGDDRLFDILHTIAKKNPDANAWDNKAVIKRLEELGVDTSPINNPQEAEPEPTEPNEPVNDEEPPSELTQPEAEPAAEPVNDEEPPAELTEPDSDKPELAESDALQRILRLIK